MADAHDHEHDHGEMVELEVKTRAEIPGDDPGEILLYPRELLWGKLREFANGFECGGKGQSGGAQSDDVDGFVGPLRAEQAVDTRPEQWQQRNNPQMLENGLSGH